VPDAGLHCKANRRGQVLFDPGNVPERLLREDVLYRYSDEIVSVDATGNPATLRTGTDQITGKAHGCF
jgi:hypothetical protein